MARELVWADIRKNIEVLQLIISLKHPKDEDKTDITVNRRNVIVKRGGALTNDEHVQSEPQTNSDISQEVCVSFLDMTVDPLSCQGLSIVQDRELQMRLHINKSQTLSSEGSGTTATARERKGLQDIVKMSCKMCGNTIIKERKFERVLELPSEHWQQTSRNLCCHGDVSNLALLQDATFSPSENDCLLGSYFIIVNADAVEAKHLAITQGETVIKCHRCSRPVGDIVMGTDLNGETQVKGIRLYKHAIITHGTNVFRKYTTEVYLSKLLHTKLQGRANFKFLVKGTSQNGESKTYALLWIMNADAAVLTNVPTIKSKYIGCLNGYHNNTDQTQANIFHGVKVLYKILVNSKNKDLKKTAGREIIHLPAEICIQLLLILTVSTYSIPPSLRQMEGFMVGYLKS